MNYKKVIENIRKELKNYIVKSNLQSLVLGVSGGIDSAIVAVLAKPVCYELKIPLIGRSISIESNKEDEENRADDIGNAFCSNYKHVDLTDQYRILKDTLETTEGTEEDIDGIKRKIRNGNIKARLRNGMYLYNIAHLHNGMVLGTTNKSEWLLGYFSLAGGDSSVDYELIIGLWKTEIYALANYIADEELTNDFEKKSLRSCIVCKPTAGLGVTDNDIEELGVSSYDEVDNILKAYYQYNMYKENCPVILRHIKSEFKRNNPYNLSREVILKDAL